MKAFVVVVFVLVVFGIILLYKSKMMNNTDEFIQARKTYAELESRDDLDTATLAGGCFWCMEAAFEQLEGVEDVLAGHTGGHVENPTYKQVGTGTTGHREAVRIYYDPKMLDYTRILEIYWFQIDPTDAGGQFVDRGEQYTTAIYYHSDEQKRQAEDSKAERSESGVYDESIVTEILPATDFYVAEDYHQSYYIANEKSYKRYKDNSGRKKYWESIKEQESK